MAVVVAIGSAVPPAVLSILALITTGWTFGVGYFQFLYVGPLAVVAYRGGRKGLAGGIMTGGAITFLLNGCAIGSILGLVAYCFVALAYTV